VDYFSDYFEIDHLRETSSKAIITKLKRTFATFGIPQEFISDNGPQFTSSEFADFTRSWDFQHKTSSPYHPQSNGKAEAAVKAAKKILEKCNLSKEDPYLCLLEHRNTPTPIVNSSPVQRLLNRRTRTTLPTITSKLKPSFRIHKAAKAAIRKRATQQRIYYDRGTKTLPTLNEGDLVWVQMKGNSGDIWSHGTIKQRINQRSYLVETPTSIVRRNRINIRKRKSPASHDTAQDTNYHEENDEAENDATTTVTLSREMITKPTTDDLESENRCNKTRSGRVIRPPRYIAETYVITK